MSGTLRASGLRVVPDGVPDLIEPPAFSGQTTRPAGLISTPETSIDPRPQPGRDASYRLWVLGADALVIALTIIVAVFARAATPFLPNAGDVERLVLPLAGAIWIGWLALLGAAGSYRAKVLGAGMGEYRNVLDGSLLAAAGLGISAYLFMYPLSRGFFFLAFLVGIPALLLERFALRRLLHRLRRAGRFRRPVILAGDCLHVDDLATILRRESWLGYDVVGLLTPDHRGCQATDAPVLGSPRDALAAVNRTHAAAVIFVEGSFSRAYQFNRLARELESEKAELIIVPSLTDVSAQRMNVRPVAGIPLVHIEKPQAERAGGWFKRLFDVVGSALLLIISSPVILATAIAIKIEDGGPVLFRQQRVGRKGETFTCYKLRSMVTNAEEIKERALVHLNESDGVLFKMKDDPRITRVGRITRRYSIDELPQFFNVLRGDMSLVGPRPALEKEVAEYESHVRRRLDVRPGITGLWQVSGRSDLSWQDTVRLDLYYVDNWSFVQDVSILLKTFRAVLGSDGAY
ncbi:sugar transferase [Acidipropionibacterium timonense]|uniref:sugar transferase n=1 Tax=Acidipropionibacterium timonense TaxID=2161818 RepID=UPI001FD91F74|nr:sugar transferase [Acidipropionibacterium timonense]